MMRRKSKPIFLVFLLLGYFQMAQGEDSTSSGSDLPGHMQPLGSHRPPIVVKRIRHLPSPAEFHRDYVTPKVPVVMDGALYGASVWRKWQSDDYLRENFGDEEVGIEEGKKENRSDPRFTLSVAEFLNRYEKEDIYMVHDLPPPMYQEWELPRPLLCGGLLDNIIHVYIWFSSGGTNSVLHTDSFENFHCLVSGKKRFTMFEPQYNRTIGPEHEKKGFYDVDVEKVDMTVYPALSRIPWYLAEVNEGDCLYLPYLWLHNVKSVGRNMGINLWWSPFKFREYDCPPHAELPEYIQLGTIELSPEIMIMDALKRASDPDGSVHAEKLHKMINEFLNYTGKFPDMHQLIAGPLVGGAIVPMDPIVPLDDVKEMFEHLQPGCNGVITNYASISKTNLKRAHEYMNDVSAPPDGGPEFDAFPDGGPEFDAFPDGGPEFDKGMHEPRWGESEEEGGGDGDIDSHDEL